MDLTGVLAINKPRGMTSHDVVFRLRKILKMKRIGHTGTLDPEVNGVLVVCLGEATKLVEFLMDGEKRYRGEITLGIATETEDAYGELIATKPVEPGITTQQIDESMSKMVGTITQTPPYYSAVKVNGKRLYEYARAGETVERPSREVVIDSFKRIDEPVYHDPDQTLSWHFDVRCGKGTYVRTLAVDLGASLGYPAHMSDLERLETGGYTLDQAWTLEEITQAVENETIQQLVDPMEVIARRLPCVEIDSDQLFAVQHGQVVDQDFFDIPIEHDTAVFYNDTLCAFYAPHPEKAGRLKPIKVMTQAKGV